MAVEKRTVVFTSEGVTVEEERQAPLSDDSTPITIDKLEWDDFPIDNLTMEVTGIEPVVSDDEETTLEALEFTVERLERSTSESRTPAPDQFWEQVKAETGITKEDGDVSLSGDKNAKSNLVAFVKFLFDHGYMNRDDLPVKSGWKRYLINTDPVHQQGDDMAQGEEVVDDVYLETKYSREDIRTKIEELADRFREQT